MTKPIAYIASLDVGDSVLSGHGATQRSALAALDSALFQHGEERGYPVDCYARGGLSRTVKLRPVILGSAWQDAHDGETQLDGISAKDEERARTE